MNTKFTNLSQREILEAIKDGVKEAFLTAMEAGDGWSGAIIRELILDAIKKGTQEAIRGKDQK
jgi:hypothetical protein